MALALRAPSLRYGVLRRRCAAPCRTRTGAGRPLREGLNRNSLGAVSTLRASPLRGSFQIAAQFVEPEKALPDQREGLIRLLRSLTPPGRLRFATASCVAAARLLVEPEGSSTPPSPPVTKKAPFGAFFVTGGEGGIRTLDTLLTYTHFPGVLLQPLGHLTGTWMLCRGGQNEARTL